MATNALSRPSTSKLTPRQQKAVMLLATGVSNEQAAIAVGVSAGLVSKWLRNEAFRNELRDAMERMRQIFEGRIMSLAANAATVIQKLMADPSLDRQTEGAKMALGAAVRLVARYKELQVEGYVPPPVPLVVFPEGTKMPWAQPSLPATIAIDVEAEVVDDSDTGTEPDTI